MQPLTILAQSNLQPAPSPRRRRPAGAVHLSLVGKPATRAEARSLPARSATQPDPYAIVHSAHDALRMSIEAQARALAARDIDSFAAEWRTFDRALAVHMAMEVQHLFRLLDEASFGVITLTQLPAAHADDALRARAVDEALAQGDCNTLAAAWAGWRSGHLEHLQLEEDIVTPLTKRTAATPQGRARIVHDRVLTPSLELPDFDWYLAWLTETLVRHGGAAGNPARAVGSLAWGLQHACDLPQWRRLRPLIEAACPAAVWAQAAAAYGLEGDGPIL